MQAGCHYSVVTETKDAPVEQAVMESFASEFARYCGVG